MAFVADIFFAGWSSAFTAVLSNSLFPSLYTELVVIFLNLMLASSAVFGTLLFLKVYGISFLTRVLP